MNVSSHSIWVFGNFYDPTNPKADPEGFVNDWKQIPPGSNSIAEGIYDADLVRAYDDSHPIDGHGTGDVYKLISTSVAYVYDDPFTKQQGITAVPKSWDLHNWWVGPGGYVIESWLRGQGWKTCKYDCITRPYEWCGEGDKEGKCKHYGGHSPQ
jgi:hypothetical protein